MKGKVIISAVSLILVVGVAIGVVVAVHNRSGENPEVKSQQRYLGAICSNTEDKKFCHDTLCSVNGTDPKAYIATVLKLTTESVIKAFNMSTQLNVEYGEKDKEVKVALDDCKTLLEDAMDSLELSNKLVRDGNIQSINDQASDILNWLSAVISYQQACTESFDSEKDGERKVKEQLNTHSLNQVQKITALGLDIVTGFSDILGQFGLKLEALKPASRRLLNNIDVDNEGYPSWFSASDRKLLGKLNKRNGWKPNVGNTNVVVAKDGSGQFNTIAAAIASYPKGFQGRFVIYVKSGVYDEYITVPKYAANILMYGDGPGKTIVTGKKHNPIKTMQTATFANTAPGFIAKSMTFENTAGAIGHQAVAFRNQGDMSAVVDCHILGYQDTLYVQTNRQFYRDCVISGTIDFIFGTSTTLIQRSTIVVRKPLDTQFNTITAEGTQVKNMATGIVIQDCQIVPEPALFPTRLQVKTYLGRPWKFYSKAVFMESNIGDLIHPDRWTQWNPTDKKEPLNLLYFAEFANTGPGANTQRAVKWPGYHPAISKAEATKFTPGQFLKAGPGAGTNWLQALNVPHYLGFKA